MFKSLWQAWKHYSSGKKFEENYNHARILIQLIFFKKLNDASKSNAILSYLFSEDPLNETDYPNLEQEVFEILDNSQDLKEIVVQTLQVKLALCQGYGNRDLFEKILKSSVFTKYGGEYKLCNINDYRRLIDRIYERNFGNKNS
jgi:hypothetical protein